MFYQIAYLNTYGNASVLADGIQNILNDAEFVDLSNQEITEDADVYLLVFEITRNSIPLPIMDALENLEEKTILCCVTSGMARFESKEGIEHSLLPFLPDECDYRGMFFCPGQIPVSVIEKAEKVLRQDPENRQAKMMIEAFRSSAGHPDIEDMRELRRFIQESGI